MAEPEKHEFKPGPKRETKKGAHGGGTEYHQMKVKYPKFALGEGFKQKPKPGKSTENPKS